MEINAQQIEALLKTQEQQAQRKAGESGQDFGVILQRQLVSGAQSEVGAVAAAPQAEMISRILLDNSSLDQNALNAAFDQAAGALDLWDSYSQAISQAQPSLRDAYSMLQDIDEQVSRLKQDAAAMQTRHAGLDEMLNQLEVLSATEKFKFNRGDYNA